MHWSVIIRHYEDLQVVPAAHIGSVLVLGLRMGCMSTLLELHEGSSLLLQEKGHN